MLRALFAAPDFLPCQIERYLAALSVTVVLLIAGFTPAHAAKPLFTGTSLILPDVQVGDDILALTLDLTDPVELIFQLDLESLGLVASQAQAACIDPYFSFTQGQLIIPVLEVGDARFQVFLDLIDAELGLFQVSPISPLLIGSATAGAPAFSIWQTGGNISLEWGSPSDNVDGYTVWFTPYQSGEPLAAENVGVLTELSVPLPVGIDFCLAVSSFGPNGDSDLSEIERFVNAEVAYTTFETDDPVLPSLFLPTLDESLGMALMFDAAEQDTPYGAVFDSEADDVNLVLAFNPDTGLLTRMTYGEVNFHFMNYTATTVDVVETRLEGESTVYPNLTLTNHAITVIAALIEAFETPAPDPLVIPSEPDPGFIQSADWAKKGLEMGLDILRAAGIGSETPGEELLTQLARYVDGFRGDFSNSAIGDDSEEALDNAQSFLDSFVGQFDCAGEPGFSCAAYALNQADFDAFRLNLPETIGEQIQNLIDALADASDKQVLLNQDCLAIADEQERMACLELQGDPEPGEQETPLPVNDVQDDGVAQELDALQDLFAQATGTVNTAELQPLMALNELSFDYEEYIGQRIWVTGYYGDETYNGDGYAFLLNSPTLLDKDERLPHHSFARLDGDLPPQEWNRAEVMIYGEIKDFATESGLFVTEPTPLITVIDAVQLSPPVIFGGGGNPVLQNGPQFMTTPGTQASACDRVVVIAGGVDANNNKVRYRQAIAAIHTKMKALGFTDSQIQVFYDNGTAIDSGGSNVVDAAAGKQAILDHIAALKEQMDPSCTLAVFVSDHGTGFETGESYGGERPVFSGEEFDSGVTYEENKFMFNAKAKAYRSTAGFEFRGKRYWMSKRADGTIRLYRIDGDSSTFLGTDANNSGVITETETGEDFNNDGDSTDGFGISVAWMEARLGEWRYRDNSWDSDGDGTKDVRLRWDGMRYVAERLVGEEWKEMGRDTDGDFKIDETDGGIDWNLDGDKNDRVGFHEGINLWGNEVLWDDEFANALKMLSDAGIHINAFMASCFSGGFVNNLKGIVENVFTGSAEDKVHWSRDDGTGKRIHDTKAFLDNLNGIDSDSWEHAGDKAIEADTTAAGEDGVKNDYTRWRTPKYISSSIFEEVGDGEYLVELNIPFEVIDDTYDFEFIFGLQTPRWDASSFEVLSGLELLDHGPIPGGYRAFDTVGIEDGLIFRIRAPEDLQMMRIELTDINHDRLGYMMAMPGDVELLTKFESQSIFEIVDANTVYIELDLPEELLNEVYDFEIYTDQQQPAWSGEIFPVNSLLPPGLQALPVPVEEGGPGLRFESLGGNEIKDLLQIAIEGSGLASTEMMRIELTDADHEVLGYVMAIPGDVTFVPKLEDSFSSFEQIPDAGIMRLTLDIPTELQSSVFDIEIYYDQQDPPLIPPLVPDLAMLPPSVTFSFVAGGIRLESNLPGVPIPDNLELELLNAPTAPLSMLRIELTDEQHLPVGWVMATPGTIPLPVLNIFDPGFHQQFEVHWTGTMLPPDPLGLFPDGSALLGQPPPFPGSWLPNGTLYFQFGGGLTFMDLLLPPHPPGLCFTNGQGIHFGQETTQGIVCPIDPLTQVFLNNGRHRVEGGWQQSMTGGVGQGYPLRSDTAAFTFSGQNTQWDTFTRVVDGCAVNGFYWTFFSATTDLNFMVTVTDTLTSETSAFTNPGGGVPQPQLDLWAFDCQAAAD